jgi:DNA-directed RNA polymerase specialized sigma24 family protein
MVLRNKCRQYVKLARNQRLKDSQIYLTSDEKEARDYEDSCVFVSAEDLEETVIFENDIKGAVKQLFEMANEQEREIMLLLMEGYRVEEIKRRLGFKHRETVRRIIKRLGKKLGYNPLT